MKYKSPLLTDAAGSIGGLNASHNKGGGYFRAKPHPKNTPTNARSRVRSAIGSLSNLWHKLTDIQRDSWTNFALEIKTPSRPGSIHILLGYQQFIRCNSARSPVADTFPPLLDAPTVFLAPPGLLLIDAYPFVQVGGTDKGRIWFYLKAEMANPPIPANNESFIFCYVSKPFNVGKSSYYGSMIYADKCFLPPSSTVPIQKYFPTQIFRSDRTPFNMVAEFVVTLHDGRVGYPLRVSSTFSG